MVTSRSRQAKGKTGRARARARLAAELARLERADLVRPVAEPEPAFLFKNALTQDAAYVSLLQHKLPSIHRYVAEAYRELYHDRLDEYAGLIAHHYAQAGDDENTLAYARRAGDAARRVYANAEAVTHYSLALAAAARLRSVEPEGWSQLYTHRGRALEVSGRFAEALANYQEMEQAGRSHADRPLELAALILAANLRSLPTNQFNPAESQRLHDAALALARALGDRRSEARILWSLLLLSGNTGRRQEAVAYADQALALARELGLREQTALILSDMAIPLAGVGQRARAERGLEEAREYWRQLDNPSMLANNLSTAANLASWTGEYERAVPLATEAYRLCREIDDPWGQVYSRFVMGLTYRELGEAADALEAIEESMRLSQTFGLPITGALGPAYFALTLAQLGSPEQGLAYSRLGRIASDRPLPPIFRVQALAALTRFHIRRGDLAAADECWQAIRPGPEHDLLALHAIALAGGELAVARGDYARAASDMERFARELQESTLRGFLPAALQAQAQALAGMGRQEDALRVLEEARTVAAGQKARLSLWEILVTMARLEQARGDQGRAAAHLAQAREPVLYISEHIEAPDLRASFLRLPDVQTILAGPEPAA